MFQSISKSVLSLLIAYLVGSFPTAFIFGKFYKSIDIRQHGSGNVGATNAFRILGKLPGFIVLIIDVLKGLICPTLIADFFGQDILLSRVLLAVIAVAGHNWTVFLRFKGGKGMATSLGVLIGLAIKAAILRPVLLICLAVWVISFILSGIVSLSSIIAAVSLPILLVFFSAPIELVVLGIVFCAFVVLRHRPNISRLINREEHQIFTPPFQRKRFP
ncbi:MAG: glycerol-3-phosphate 1-O-acyltransferase PlsY [Candidatus Omnitrophota bacterium]|nr:glycerol-3-phosphate 1-O-acyltransferase PlsY [Candidatus Omnitrophota bacterium]